jgi:hypothetical protein
MRKSFQFCAKVGLFFFDKFDRRYREGLELILLGARVQQGE